MKKKSLALCLLPLLLGMVSCSRGDDLTLFTADLYMPKALSDGNYSAEKVMEWEYAVTDLYGENEAFVSVDSVLELLQENLIPLSIIEKEKGNDGVSYRIRGVEPGEVTITVNHEKNTVTFSDYEVYRSLGEDYVNDSCSLDEVDLLELEENLVITKNPGGFSFTFSLGEYGIDILGNGESVYIPTAVSSYLFLDPLELYASFNGEAFHCSSSPSYLSHYVGEEREYTDFGKSYYGGPLEGTSPSREVAALHGNETMFYLDHFYGFPDRTDFDGRKYSEYLKEEHKEEYDLFFSTAADDSQKGWDFVANVDIGDGHTNTRSDLGSFYTGGEFSSESPISEKTWDLYMKFYELSGLRGDLSKESMYQEHGDMAVIRFDDFAIDLDVSDSWTQEQYQENMEDDVYSLFAYSFSRIKENPSIKKVIIDITCNGGGAVPAGVEALCFLKEEVALTVCDTVTGALTTTTYSAKLPGGISSYECQYDFYVLQSGYSFSCGNLFPTLAKNNGIATILGEKSGGGACAIRYLADPNGQWIQISGPRRFSLSNGVESNDGGVEPDVALDSSCFYDLDKLSEAIDAIA